jgi:uncharacterized damage-inducible protein DinB
MISIEKSLEHMAWSNQRIFEEFSKFSDEVYGLRAAEGEWPVGQILSHFLNAAEWFRYLLTKQEWTDLPQISNNQVLLESKQYLAELDLLIIAEAAKPDGPIHFRGDTGSEETTTRSLIFAQAPMHAAEHKGQLATILKQHGLQLDLDALDLWRFESRNM